MKKKIFAVLLAAAAVFAMSVSVYAYANYQVDYETVDIAAGSSYSAGLYIYDDCTAGADTFISNAGLPYSIYCSVSAYGNGDSDTAYDNSSSLRMLDLEAYVESGLNTASSAHSAYVVINDIQIDGQSFAFFWPN